MKELAVNSVLEWRNETLEITSVERVLWIDPSRTDVVVIDTMDLKSDPFVREFEEVMVALETPYVKFLEIDPYAKTLSADDDFLKKHGSKRDRAWRLIKDIVEVEPDIYDRRRGSLVTSVCEEHKVSRKVVLEYLRKFWVRGKTMNALLPGFDNCGNKGKSRPGASGGKKRGRPRIVTRVEPELEGVNVTSGDLKNIRIAIDTYYNTAKKHPFRTAWKAMLRELYNIGIYYKDDVPIPILKPQETVPSLAQFRYHAHQMIDLEESLRKRLGTKKYLKDYRHLKGNSTSSGPGAVFEIDATVADAYLLSSFDPNRIIGRPVVYIVKDVFTRMVTGVYVGLEGPSWIGAIMALQNTTQDKVEFCRQYGIEIEDWEWPSHHLPKVLMADRGELESSNTDYLTQNLGVRVDNAPPYRADLKGIVEQHFRLLNLKLGPFMPGAIRKEFRERGEPDYRLQARLTIESFTRCIIKSILLHNKTEIKNYPISKEMWSDDVPPIPIELWQWGVANASGYLIEKSRNEILLNLMPRAEASLTKRGLYFNQMYYSVDDSVLSGWNERLHGRKKMQVCFDPRNCDYVYIPAEDGKGFLTCHLTEYFERFQGHRIEVVQDQMYYEGVESTKRSTSQMQLEAEHDTEVQHEIAKATEQTEQALDPSMSKSEKTGGIRENRKQERETIRDKEAFDLEQQDQTTTDDTMASKDETPAEQYTSNHGSLFAKIKNNRDQRRAAK